MFRSKKIDNTVPPSKVKREIPPKNNSRRSRGAGFFSVLFLSHRIPSELGGSKHMKDDGSSVVSREEEKRFFACSDREDWQAGRQSDGKTVRTGRKAVQVRS